MHIYEEYLKSENTEYRQALFSTVLHNIKYAGRIQSDEGIKHLVGDLPFDIESLDDSKLLLLARLAVAVDFLYCKYFDKWAVWTRHPRLRLEKPYFGRGYKWYHIFDCPQEMLSHNVFFDVGSLEVI